MSDIKAVYFNFHEFQRCIGWLEIILHKNQFMVIPLQSTSFHHSSNLLPKHLNCIQSGNNRNKNCIRTFLFAAVARSAAQKFIKFTPLHSKAKTKEKSMQNHKHERADKKHSLMLHNNSPARVSVLCVWENFSFFALSCFYFRVRSENLLKSSQAAVKSNMTKIKFTLQVKRERE